MEARSGQTADHNPDRVTRVVGTPKHLAAAQTIADHSITLLKNDDHLLPLKVPATTKVLVTGFGQTTTATLAKDLASRGLAAQALPTGSSPTPDDIAKAVQAAEESDLVVVSTFNAWGQTNPQVELVNALLALGKPVVVAAVGTPYDVAYLPNAPTFIASYGYQPVSVNALVKVMFGELQPTGRLPVTITEPPPSTKALYRFG